MIQQFRAKGNLISNSGPRRSINEDACLFGRSFVSVNLTAPIEAECQSGNDWIIAVADGLGGHAGGAHASAEVVCALAQCANVSPDGVTELFERLNSAFVELGVSKPLLAGLGATVAGIAAGADGLFIFNIGDARVYRQHDRFLSQITDDDSLARVLAESGQVAEQNARAASANRLTQAIGGKVQYKEVTTHIHRVDLRPCSRFLICSDGLSDTLSLDHLEELTMPGCSTSDSVRSLFEAASQADCKDNISIIVVDVSGQSEPESQR